MFCRMLFWMAASVLAVVRGRHQSPHLSRNVGDKVSFSIKPQIQIRGIAVWTFGSSKAVIVQIVQMKILLIKSKRYQVDLKTGSLTINDLILSDGGVYGFQVHNGRKIEHEFILTVVDGGGGSTEKPPHPPGNHGNATLTQSGNETSSTPEPPRDRSRTHWVPLGVVGVIVFMVIGLVARAVKKRNKETHQGGDGEV